MTEHNTTPIPFVIGCSFHTAPLEMLEQLAIGRDDLQSVVNEISGWLHCDNLVVLSTCNRTELIGTATDVATTQKQVMTYFNTVSENVVVKPEYLYCYTGRDAVGHLFRVICGVDSMMIGETEIVGQIQFSYGVAQCEGLAGNYFVQLFDAAFRASKRVRGETAIDKGTTSVAKAGVHMARRIVGDLSKRKVLMIGAGETGALTCTYLNEERATIGVANRTLEKAKRLAADVGGQVVPFEDLEAAILDVDVVFLATDAKTPLVTKELITRVQKKRRGELLLVVDISLPHNASPDIVDVGNVFLFNMSDLKDMVAKSVSMRAGEKKQAESIIRAEVDAFFTKQRTHEVGPLIAALRASYENVCEQELSRYEHRFGDAEREMLRQFASGLVNKLLHLPTMGVRDLATDDDTSREKVEWFEKLFGLDDTNGTRMRKK